MQKPSFPPCLAQKPPLFVALALQLPTRHLPCAPCLPHKPRAIALAVQPSIEHGFLPWVMQSPLAVTLFEQPSTEHTFFFFFPPPIPIPWLFLPGQFIQAVSCCGQEDADSAVNVVHYVHFAFGVHMEHCGVVQRILPPHAHPVTNREVSLRHPIAKTEKRWLINLTVTMQCLTCSACSVRRCYTASEGRCCTIAFQN